MFATVSRKCYEMKNVLRGRVNAKRKCLDALLITRERVDAPSVAPFNQSELSIIDVDDALEFYMCSYTCAKLYYISRTHSRRRTFTIVTRGRASRVASTTRRRGDTTDLLPNQGYDAIASAIATMLLVTRCS